MEAGFVARGFSGMEDHLTGLIQKAIRHPGFALVDILQPCVSFNKVNTYGWYKKRCYELPASYDFRRWDQALEKAREWGERIPVGVLYENTRPTFEAHLQALMGGPVIRREVDRERLEKILETFL